MRRRQAHRFVVAATGRLLRLAQQRAGAGRMRIAPELLAQVDQAEIAARTRVTPAQVAAGLNILLPELSALLADYPR